MAVCEVCQRVHATDEVGVLCAIGAGHYRHVPDADLCTELEYYRREAAERPQDKNVTWHINCLSHEAQRRQKWAKRVPFCDTPGIPTDIIAEIKRRATGPDFVEIVERQVNACAVKKGKIYWAPCPVHHEKQPSFAIYPEQGTVHCYGCQFDADVFGLFTDMPPGLKFPEAVREVARLVRVEIPKHKPIKEWNPKDGLAARET